MLNTKVAMVTGCSGDIGINLSKKLIEKKYKLICHIRKKNENFKKFENKNKKNILMILKFDFLDQVKMGKELNRVIKKIPKIDVLINNAGSPYGGILELTKIEKLKEVFEVNLFCHIFIIQKLLRLLKKADSPSIINISSISGIYALRGNSIYGSSKAAMNYMTKVLALELKRYGIKINAIAPSVIENKMGKLMDKTTKRKLFKIISTKKPIKQDKVINKILFLLSDKSKLLIEKL